MCMCVCMQACVCVHQIYSETWCWCGLRKVLNMWYAMYVSKVVSGHVTKLVSGHHELSRLCPDTSLFTYIADHMLSTFFFQTAPTPGLGVNLMYTYTCLHTYIHTHTHMPTCLQTTYIQACRHTYMHAYVHMSACT